MCDSVTFQIESLYGLDNFYYRRSRQTRNNTLKVYTDLIISTIVDNNR